MKKAFTMIELVFVIVIVGIISAMIAPSFGGNNLRQAADQVVSHIRYTQHLAMMDNKFDLNDKDWYRARWAIRFVKDIHNGPSNCGGKKYDGIWSYMIYTNTNHANTNVEIYELAKNPMNTNQLLSGGNVDSICPDNSYNVSDKQSTKNMRLNEAYGITNVSFSEGCGNNAKYINFDNQGRPFNNFSKDFAYSIGTTWKRLLTKTCNITLTDGLENITIAIEPETGYTHIL